MDYFSKGPGRLFKATQQRSARRPWTMLGVLLIGLLMAGLTQAVTLGQIRVISYLNQPLEAEIELVGVEPGQHEDLRIRIANQDQFERLGIPYTNFLADLRFDVIQTSGRWVVRVRSRQPVNEPFLDFPVQMTWPGGQIVRQYTLLLDPLTLSRPSTVQRAAPPPATPSGPSARSEPTIPPMAGYGGGTYGPVQRGETLWPIAQKLKPRGITTQQMAMALLRANPQAFIDRNINRLRAGSVLTVPPLGEIERIDAATAARQFIEQTRQWRAPVATSPREVVTSSPPPLAPPTEADSAAQAEAVERPTEELQAAEATAQQSEDQLRIVTDKEAQPAASEDESIKQQLLVTMEEIESNRIATGEIESRLAQLEQELSKMQALIDLKDQQIAALQSEIAERDEMEQAAGAARPTPSDALSRPAPASESAVAKTPAPAPGVEGTAESQAPITVEAEAVPSAEPTRIPWFEQYQWMLYVMLGVVAVLLVLWLIRRQFADTNGSNVPMSDLPSAPPTPVYPGARQPAREELHQAERDFQGLAATSTSETAPETRTTESPPKVGLAEANAADRETEELTNALLDEILEEGKELDRRPEPKFSPEVSEDDIASWVEELGSELDQLDVSDTRTADTAPIEPAPSKNKPPQDDEIPSLLTALDDQLGKTDSTVSGSVSNIELEPLDEPSAESTSTESANDHRPDDTFTMSLDLARAYLEIGDNDGASDMLKQALASTNDPEHRRQIEEMLQQIR